MSAKTIRHSILLLSLCGVLVACGKKEEPAPEPDKTAEEAGKDEADADVGHGEAADTEAKSDEDAGKIRRPSKDRLAGRRPPPLRRDPKTAEAPDAGAGQDAVAPEPSADAGPAASPTATDAGPSASPTATDAGPTAPEIVEPARLRTDPATAPDVAPPEPGHVAAPGPATRAPVPGQALDAARLLSLQGAIDITQAKDLVLVGALPGIASSPLYGSIFYKAPNPNDYGVSVQAWQDPARRESDDRFRRMRLQYPNAEDVQVLAPVKAFFAQFGKIQMLTFVDSVKRTVVSVGCGEGVCSHDELVKLARAVRDHL